jgi:hypothetical protein
MGIPIIVRVLVNWSPGGHTLWVEIILEWHVPIFDSQIPDATGTSIGTLNQLTLNQTGF